MTDRNLPGIQDIAQMMDILKEGGWRNATLKLGDFELTVSDSPTGAADAATGHPVAPAPAPAPAPPAPASSSPSPSAPSTATDRADAVVEGEGLHIVTAETLGAFWRSPQPGAPAFVEVGDEVDADSPLGIVEVMKLMTRITPGKAGRVAAIHVQNGDLVELGQPLMTIATL